MKVIKKNYVFTLLIMVLLGGVAANSNHATVQAYEVSGFYQYETNDTGITITKYTGGELSVTIPSKIAGKKVTAIGSRAFSDNDMIEHVIIPTSVITIYGGVFYDCDSLQEITIPNNVTTLDSASYGNYDTFGYCDNLTTVIIGDGVTALNNNCFIECPKLSRVTIGKGVTSIGDSVFENCDSLTSITIPASVKSIGLHCFTNCDNLKTVTLSYGLDTIYGGAFYNCSSLTEMIIPNSVITLDSAEYGNYEIFGKCSNLLRLQLPNSVATIGEALVNESQSVIIYGYANSTAAQYATDHSIPFQELPSLPAEKFSFNESEILLMVGEKQVLDYTIQPENTTDAILWKSSDENIAAVDNIGIVTAKNLGSVSVVATTTSGKKGSITLIIQEAPRSISFKTAAKTLA
ncbi:MAG: Fibronectin type domain protein, partial [Herbinix sp.]|nr:Fibronectin type domain protein [Herbinix sp.]